MKSPTPEEITRIQAAIVIISAATNGKVVEWNNTDSGWITQNPLDSANLYNVLAHPEFYRVKPKRVTRPWKFEEAPISLRVRRKNTGALFRVESYPEGIALCSGYSPAQCNRCTYEKLLESYEQLDGSPCGITEAQ